MGKLLEYVEIVVVVRPTAESGPSDGEVEEASDSLLAPMWPVEAPSLSVEPAISDEEDAWLRLYEAAVHSLVGKASVSFSPLVLIHLTLKDMAQAKRLLKFREFVTSTDVCVWPHADHLPQAAHQSSGLFFEELKHVFIESSESKKSLNDVVASVLRYKREINYNPLVASPQGSLFDRESFKDSPVKHAVCIGDIHGEINKVHLLWKNLAVQMTPKVLFEETVIICLGDYCDRGPNTRLAFDWLVALKAVHPRSYFIAGNHDFSMATFLGVIPAPSDFSFRSTWSKDVPRRKDESQGWWSGTDEQNDGMHLQGRRWGGVYPPDGIDSVYSAAATFWSYGVDHGDFEGLVEAVPNAHKIFLRDLDWVVEVQTSFGPIMAIHAGLDNSKDVHKQLSMLRSKDCTFSHFSPISGRDNVIAIPPFLEQKGVVLVSGHHRMVMIEPQRIILDECGGIPDLPLSAIILPERAIVKSE